LIDVVDAHKVITAAVQFQFHGAELIFPFWDENSGEPCWVFFRFDEGGVFAVGAKNKAPSFYDASDPWCQEWVR
jgi:hypothetical protein